LAFALLTLLPRTVFVFALVAGVAFFVVGFAATLVAAFVFAVRRAALFALLAMTSVTA
jgi:hypothetical protein